MSVLDMLEKSTHEFADLSKEWRFFVMDHRRHILSNSTVEELNETEVHIHEFRPYDYLKTKGYPLGALWIVLWLNDISNETKFSNIKSIYLPKLDYLDNLRKEYITYRTELKKAAI